MKQSDTVISGLDIYRSAQLIVDQHGDEAPVFAAMQADNKLVRGDMEGMAAWHRILAAVRVLVRPRPADRDMLH